MRRRELPLACTLHLTWARVSLWRSAAPFPLSGPMHRPPLLPCPSCSALPSRQTQTLPPPPSSPPHHAARSTSSGLRFILRHIAARCWQWNRPVVGMAGRWWGKNVARGGDTPPRGGGNVRMVGRAAEGEGGGVHKRPLEASTTCCRRGDIFYSD